MTTMSAAFADAIPGAKADDAIDAALKEKAKQSLEDTAREEVAEQKKKKRKPKQSDDAADGGEPKKEEGPSKKKSKTTKPPEPEVPSYPSLSLKAEPFIELKKAIAANQKSPDALDLIIWNHIGKTAGGLSSPLNATYLHQTEEGGWALLVSCGEDRITIPMTPFLLEKVLGEVSHLGTGKGLDSFKIIYMGKPQIYAKKADATPKFFSENCPDAREVYFGCNTKKPGSVIPVVVFFTKTQQRTIDRKVCNISELFTAIWKRTPTKSQEELLAVLPTTFMSEERERLKKVKAAAVDVNGKDDSDDDKDGARTKAVASDEDDDDEDDDQKLCLLAMARTPKRVHKYTGKTFGQYPTSQVYPSILDFLKMKERADTPQEAAAKVVAAVNSLKVEGLEPEGGPGGELVPDFLRCIFDYIASQLSQEVTPENLSKCVAYAFSTGVALAWKAWDGDRPAASVDKKREAEEATNARLAAIAAAKKTLQEEEERAALDVYMADRKREAEATAVAKKLAEEAEAVVLEKTKAEKKRKEEGDALRTKQADAERKRQLAEHAEQQAAAAKKNLFPAAAAAAATTTTEADDDCVLLTDDDSEVAPVPKQTDTNGSSDRKYQETPNGSGGAPAAGVPPTSSKGVASLLSKSPALASATPAMPRASPSSSAASASSLSRPPTFSLSALETSKVAGGEGPKARLPTDTAMARAFANMRAGRSI